MHPETWEDLIRENGELRARIAQIERSRLMDSRSDLERAVEERTSQIRAIQTATLNMMEDAVEANARLQLEIAERRQAEAALELKERAIATSMNGIAFTDAQGLFTYANPAALRIWGLEREEDVLGRPAREKYADPLEGDRIRREILEHGFWTGETRIRRAGGAEATVLASAHVVREADGSVRALVATFIDITDRVQEERDRRLMEAQLRQAQKLESLGILAGGIAHDFNNLLMAINGFADIALEDLPELHPVRTSVEQVRLAGRRGAALTRQLLAFSRRQPMRMETLNVNDLIQGMKKMLRRLIREDVELALALDPALGCVRADPGQLEQVVMNLVVNARDACKPGGRIEVSTAAAVLGPDCRSLHASAYPGTWVAVAITDDGCGMDAATLERIFDPFYTTKEMGTGLGLATVVGIVEQCGGFVRVDSAPGRGSRFEVYLPQEAGAPAGTTPAPARAEPQGRGETILLVEDDPPVRRLLAQTLFAAGYRVMEAANGREAQVLLETCAKEVSLVLSDIVMPLLNGPEFVEQARAVHPGLRVLFMSGYSDHPIFRGTGPGSGQPLLAKPYSREELLAKVQEVLAG